LIVRKAVPEDFAALADLWFDSWMSIGIANETDLPREAVRARFHTEVSDRWSLFAAERNGDIAGMLALVLGEFRIEQIFVDPVRKGTGIGRALMDQAKAVFPDRIVLVTHTDNHRACQFYERHGFLLERLEDDDFHRRQKRHYIWRSEI
jgi:ribosomal protein S18 acetylase RimI-like enzyme